MNETISQAKAELRRSMTAARRAAAASARDAAEAVRERLQAGFAVPADACVSGYWPMRDELDPLPALRALGEAGHRLCLPVVLEKARPLRFRAWAPGDPLVAAAFGTQVPAETAAEAVPDLLLVPLLAFDRTGYRLGYGGGFYDRTLAALRAEKPVLAVGVAYAAQEVEAVPTDANDRRLDALVTEDELLRFS
jgi:5-formyltetrahydrofolate cyclo-ligase